MTILEAGVTNVSRRNIGMLGQLPRYPLRVGIHFFDEQVVVFTVTTELESEFFGYVEFIGL